MLGVIGLALSTENLDQHRVREAAAIVRFRQRAPGSLTPGVFVDGLLAGHGYTLNGQRAAV
jgi:hypothetical protein